MRVLSPFFSAILLLVWLPTSSLCHLEKAFLTQESECCEDEKSSRPQPFKSTPATSCCLLVSSTYVSATPERSSSLQQKADLDASGDADREIEIPASNPVINSFTSEPANTANHLFVQRRALPARAPTSFL